MVFGSSTRRQKQGEEGSGCDSGNPARGFGGEGGPVWAGTSWWAGELPHMRLHVNNNVTWSPHAVLVPESGGGGRLGGTRLEPGAGAPWAACLGSALGAFPTLVLQPLCACLGTIQAEGSGVTAAPPGRALQPCRYVPCCAPGPAALPVGLSPLSAFRAIFLATWAGGDREETDCPLTRI